MAAEVIAMEKFLWRSMKLILHTASNLPMGQKHRLSYLENFFRQNLSLLELLL